MTRRTVTIIILCLTAVTALGQNINPSDYIYPILNVEGLYSANFGEIRPGHFHAGVDIKTEGAEGRPLVAVADGYVSRIHLGPHGYGRAIYLTLNNGTTAVYGHLQRFRKDIEEHLRAERYNRRSNRFDLWFGAGQWSVKQGDTIAFSGNSGTSFGPHLHYEIRDTRTQRLINPVREGIITPADTLPPLIMYIHYIEVDTVQGVPLHSRPMRYAATRKTQGEYHLPGDKPIQTGRKGYFVLEASDRHNGVGNSFGLWRASLSADGQKCFEYRMDGFTHDIMRNCDAVSYYPLQLTSRNETIRLAQLDRSPDCFYTAMLDRGLIRTEEGQKRSIHIEAEDDCGNISHLRFDISGRKESFTATADSLATILHPDMNATVRLGSELIASVPAGTVYEPIFCRPEICEAPLSDSTAIVLSPAYRILDITTPLRRAMNISINVFVPENLRKHTALASRNAKGRISYIGGKYSKGAVSASTKTTGEIFVVADTLPPRIRPLFTDGADLTRAGMLRFGVSDNFSGIGSYTLYIDGKWAACDRYPVQGTLVHKFDTPATRSKHSVKLEVTDDCGNTAQWDGTFVR